MHEEQAGRDELAETGGTEGLGERLLGSLLDRAHTMPPQLIAPLIAQEIARIGGREVTVLLQDYDQMTLVALPGEGCSRVPGVRRWSRDALQAATTTTSS